MKAFVIVFAILFIGVFLGLVYLMLDLIKDD